MLVGERLKNNIYIPFAVYGRSEQKNVDLTWCALRFMRQTNTRFAAPPESAVISSSLVSTISLFFFLCCIIWSVSDAIYFVFKSSQTISCTLLNVKPSGNHRIYVTHRPSTYRRATVESTVKHSLFSPVIVAIPGCRCLYYCRSRWPMPSQLPFCDETKLGHFLSVDSAVNGAPTNN